MTPFYGVSAYPAAGWDEETVDNYFRCFPDAFKRPATALLWGPWGYPVAFAKRFIDWAGSRSHLVEIHISAETARRTGRNGRQIARNLGTTQYNKALEQHSVKVLNLVDKRVDEIVASIGPFTTSKTTVMLSVGLEDNLSQAAAGELLDAVRARCGGWKVVRNPMLRQPKLGKELIEGHGRVYHPGQAIWNFDGVHVGPHPTLDDIGYENALKVIQQANKAYKAVFLWSATAQGWKNEPAQPYPGRRFVITKEEQIGFRFILRNI